MMKTLLAILLMILACACRSETSGQWREPMIPSLDWEERSDWTSVKTPKSWHGQTAKGDGVADDTSALQLTIAAADPMGGTVYLPPGRYRITDTLILGTLQESSATRPEGFSIIGHGRDTVIVWDGPEGMPMMRLMGISACRIVGVTFEGAGKASCVFDMGGPAFQGHNLFRHCAFLNTTKGGIVSGLRKMNTACTEQRIDNCLFENCGTAILLGDFNDYDCVIEGCEFRDCDYGVWTWHGMFYCRDCHFENSKKADFSYFSEHTSSIRRVSSLNSNRFIEFRTPHTAMVVQDCRVRGWRDPEGAIWHDILPAVVTDSTFTGQPGAETVFHFAHDPVEGEVPCNEGPNSQMYRVILRGNTLENARLHDGSQPVKFYEIPDDGAVKLSDFDASTSFLKTRAVRGVWTDDPRTACIPGKIFDVKRDFGAKGGEADDTASFKAAIQAAREHGRGAMVYIPRGHWTVREPSSWRAATITSAVPACAPTSPGTDPRAAP